LIRVKSEVIQRAKANRISVLVLPERLAVPSYGTADLSYTPWRAAITLVIECPVVCPAGFLRWRVKVDVADVNPRSQRHAERLNRTIKVHVVQGVFVVPDSGRRVGYIVAHKPDAIVPRIGLELIYCGASVCPGHDSRLHSNCGRHCVETERRVVPGNAELAI